jgi:hypothetical protein
MISVPAYLLTRVNPVWIFKIMGPILYGTMILALYRFLRLGLSWTEKMSLGGGLMTSLYFVTLRISWDLYRNMLGLTFVLLSLPLFGSMKERRRQILLAGLVVLAVASDQLTGVIALSIIGARVLMDLVKKRWDDVERLVKVGVPGLTFFLAIAYAEIIVPGRSLVQPQAPVPGLDSLASSAGFLGYVYLPIIPLALLGLRRTVNKDLRNWTLVLMSLALSALIPLFGFIVTSYRWSLLLDIPLCVYSSAGIASILGAGSPVINCSRLAKGKILPIFSVILVVSAALYIVVPAQNAMLYYTTFPSYFPTSMLQDTVPISDMSSLRTILDWVQVNMGPNSVLITHQAIYGWARAYLPSLSSHVVNYQYNGPLAGVELARSEGYSSVLMIWWANGSGWHNQPFVPSGFAILMQKGDLALYEYY